MNAQEARNITAYANTAILDPMLPIYTEIRREAKQGNFTATIDITLVKNHTKIVQILRDNGFRAKVKATDNRDGTDYCLRVSWENPA